MYCRIPTLLAYAMLTYVIASIYYWLVTRTYGTPFKDALQESGNEKLLQIRKESSQKRGTTFLVGLVVAVILLILLRPFDSC